VDIVRSIWTLEVGIVVEATACDMSERWVLSLEFLKFGLSLFMEEGSMVGCVA
jgi:hypothetical protein